MNWDVALANAAAELGPGGAVDTGDVTDRLPSAAGEHLRMLREVRQELHDKYLPTSSRFDDALQDFRRAEEVLKNLESAARRGEVTREEEVIEPFMGRASEGERGRGRVTRRVEPDLPRLEAERARVGKLGAEMERIRDKRDGLSWKFQQAAKLSTACETWAKAQRRFKEVPVAAPKLKANTSITAAIEDIRIALPHLLADLDRVRNAPRPPDEMKADAARQVDALFARGEPDVALLLEPGGTIHFPSIPQQSFVVTPAGTTASGSTSVPDTLGLLAWLGRDDLLRRIEAKIDEIADPKHALSAEDRVSDILAIRRDLLAKEREEEALIRELEAAGGSLLRRGDASPAATLGLADPQLDEGE